MKKNVRKILTNQKIDSKLREWLIEDADEIEKALESDHKLDGIEVPEDMLDKITASLKKKGYWEEDE